MGPEANGGSPPIASAEMRVTQNGDLKADLNNDTTSNKLMTTSMIEGSMENPRNEVSFL